MTSERPQRDPGASFDRAAAEAASELLPDGLVTVDGRGVVVHANHVALRITGHRLEDLVGRPVREALPLTDRDGSLWWDVTDPWRGLATRKGHRERLLMLDDGREVLATARYLRPGRGQPPYAVLLGLRDAETRRRAERDHAALISTVSHELRSPLTGVKGFAATLLRNWDRFTDEQKRFMVEAIEADADRVTRLITDLLDVSRLDAGRMSFRPVPVDVGPALQRHADRQVNGGLGDRELRVDVVEGAALHVDPDRLDQILANLIENAVRHGEGTITVRAEPASDARGWTDLLVADEGQGIAPEHRSIAFTRFWHNRERRGTGLGLYLVRGLAEAHGGTVSVEDAPGGGALFRVRLPAEPARD